MSRIKYFETITNSRGDSLANYRVQVVDSTGAIVTIYQDEAGTRFQDAAGNVVNFTLAGPAGKAEFWWEPASGQILQVLDAAGNLVDATDGFANKYVLNNLPGNIATAAVEGLDDQLSSKTEAADLASTAAGKGPALVGFIGDAGTAEPRTLDLKAREVRSVLDFAPASYTNPGRSLNDALNKGDLTTALQNAIDWQAAAELRAIHVPGFIACSNITLRNSTTLIGDGRQTSGFVALTGTAGKWFSALDAQKNIQKDLAFYGRDQPGMTHIMELVAGQAGTEGFVEGCWYRDCINGYAFLCDGNVYYVRNCTFESAKYLFTGTGTGNKAENITLMQAGHNLDAGSGAADAYALDINGWQIDRLHVEAPNLICDVPVRMTGDCMIQKMTISPSASPGETSTWKSIIEVDQTNYLDWSVSDVMIYNPSRIAVTEPGVLRYGNPTTPSFRYYGGKQAVNLSGMHISHGLMAHNAKLDLGAARFQALSVRLTKSGGVVSHRIRNSSASDDPNGVFQSRITGASKDLVTTPTGGNPFVNGGSILTSGNFVFDTSAQVPDRTALIANVAFNNTGTAYTAWPYIADTTVNGITQKRLILEFRDANGTLLPATAIAEGKILEIQIMAFLL